MIDTSVTLPQFAAGLLFVALSSAPTAIPLASDDAPTHVAYSASGEGEVVDRFVVGWDEMRIGFAGVFAGALAASIHRAQSRQTEEEARGRLLEDTLGFVSSVSIASVLFGAAFEHAVAVGLLHETPAFALGLGGSMGACGYYIVPAVHGAFSMLYKRKTGKELRP